MAVLSAQTTGLRVQYGAGFSKNKTKLNKDISLKKAGKDISLNTAWKPGDSKGWELV